MPVATPDETFDTTVAILESHASGNGRVWTGVVDPKFGNAFNYLRSTQQYSFVVTQNHRISTVDESTSFGPSNIKAELTNARYTYYSSDCGDDLRAGVYRYRLNLFNEGNGNDQLKLNYASFGYFQFFRAIADVLGGTQDISDRYFGYGHITPTGGLPSSATFTYNGVVIGQYLSKSNVFPGSYAITGTMTVTVNYVARSFTGSITLVKAGSEGYPAGPAGTTVGTFPIVPDASVAFPRIAGTFADGGRFEGFVSGPTAEEMSGSFHMSRSDTVSSLAVPADIVGSGAAKR